jgi:hypothetical protein
LRTDNEKTFPSRLYLPEDTPDEFRGAGTMHETARASCAPFLTTGTLPMPIWCWGK